MTQVCIVTSIPSPYQVEFFDALAADGLDLQVVYRFRQDRARHWAPRPLNHPHVFADEADVPAQLTQAALVVFCLYRDARVRSWLHARAASARPWCFWGERPGVHWRGPGGRSYRRWRLAPLAVAGVPVWGIGRFALQRYAEEFGANRLLLNVPYFSNLARFAPPAERSSHAGPRLLFSGSLIRRKGVDLLARAYARVAPRWPRLSLRVLGSGPLEPALRQLLAPFAERVRFDGFRDWDALPQVYAEADVLVAPSRHDGWGLVVAEGMAAGLPVVASNRTGAALDLVSAHRNGWLVEAGDVGALAAALANVAALTPEAWSSCSAAARASVATHGLGDGVQRFRNAVGRSLLAFGRTGY